MSDTAASRAMIKSGWGDWDRLRTDQQRQLAPPPAEKPCAAGAQRVALVPPQAFTVGEMPLREAIARRQSHRSYTDAALSVEELSFLLWACQGVRDADGHSVRRTVPSAGSRHPFETYVVANRVTSVAAGLYRYLSLSHELCLQGAGRDAAESVSDALYGQYVLESAVTLLWTAIPYRTEWRYGSLAPRLIALDAGHLCQNVYLAATAIGGGACAIGAYDQGGVDEALGVDGEDEFVVYAATIGKVE